MTVTDEPGVRALLADGRVVAVRELGPADEAEVLDLHARLSDRDQYLRFFGPLAPLGSVARRIARARDDGHGALGAYLDGGLVGVAHYEVLGADPGSAEIALVVDGAAQAHGVGTLLLEHLASLGRARGLRRFVADVLAENYRMIKVFVDAGLAYRWTGGGPERQVVISLEPDETYLEAVGERERVADVASLVAVLRPGSVAVVGAGRRSGSVGNAVLRNLRAAGFTGTLSAVNPHANEVAGVRCWPSVADLPEVPDLAVVCVPAAAVPDAVEQCGRRGIRAAVVISAGLSGSRLGPAVLDAVRRHGMRLVGPNCVGVVNTDPAVRLDATFARGAAPAGRVGVVTQSGGVGIALMESLRQLGLGVSTLVSTGDKYDVSSNDLLLWWRQDTRTDIAVLYLESFGNPRKFSRVARALARTKPVLAVRPAGSTVAQRAAASHTAATATPAVTRDALFEQAGVIAVDTVGELVDTIAALSWQPLPAGNRVVVLSNAGGSGVLAADACVHNGLIVTELAPATTEALRALLPAQASVTNPVDTTATVDAPTFAACLDVLLAADEVDAVMAAGVPTALGDPITAVVTLAGSLDKPVLAVRPGQLASVTGLAATSSTIACYADPAPAAAALGRIARYAAWRRHPAGHVPDLTGLAVPGATGLVRTHLSALPSGGWLEPLEVTALLESFGIPVLRPIIAEDAEQAVAAWRRFGAPVAIKAIADTALHKSAAGGVLLDLADETEVRAAVDTLAQRFGAALRGMQVQPMVPAGRELIVGVSSDELFGPLVVFGLGGTDTDLIADRTARLAPLTDTDVERMVHGLRSSPALFGPNAKNPLPTDDISDVLLRVGRMAELLPEIAELDLNPLVVTETGCVAVDARIRIEPRHPTDPFLRRLRG
ncbi:MAG TPA: GNAT family N-acetyltransferase [Actinophytocola sp.]|uniref:bifunctional acetate--CoA ligase family protein/GNAT family N-acetyltransferase n=1 Tax=Actinophytocola sp. TaxID=1872138 RepID=UPI002DBA3F27|nr:GNAT family N-acetyltransferase [Actinophytocola sp.]HEU5474940.1 GNAT family N-acetyltransferase [Actinophytocola sp.]